MAYKQLKRWFDGALATLLSEKISAVNPDFNSQAFISDVEKGVDELELKARVELMADALYASLPGNYEEQINLLMQTLSQENEEETGMFTNFYWIMPMAKLVEKYGLEHFDISMKAIVEITKRNTGEYTIRPYLEVYPEKTLKRMLAWSKDQNKHVRRLASEGARPRLPWASKLQQYIDDPKPILPILDQLKDDKSKYVQKSVANCLNDILKDNPAIAKLFIDGWLEGATKERKWIIKHALRNLKKKEDVWALAILNDL